MNKFYFINEDNKHQYQKRVLNWLQKDFKQKNNPSHHFWHNREIIASAFSECHAMVALNARNQAIGFMIWSFYEGGAEIDIVEVKEAYRQQKIFSTMLSKFSERFPRLLALSASVIPSARFAFTRMGWENTVLHNQVTFFKPLRSHLPLLDSLPDGLALAVCSEDFYMIKNNPHDYLDRMRYFGLEVDEAGNLLEPVVTSCSSDGYLGVYLDKVLIKESKPKNLEDMVSCHSGIFLMDKISGDLFMEVNKKIPTLKRSREEASDDSISHIPTKKEKSEFSYRTEVSTGSSLFSGTVKQLNTQVAFKISEDKVTQTDLQRNNSL